MGNIASVSQEFGLIIISGLIFVASFLWRDFLNDMKESYFPKKSGLIMGFIYTLLITLIILTLVVYLKSIFGLSGTLGSPEPTIDKAVLKNGNGNGNGNGNNNNKIEPSDDHTFDNVDSE